MFEYSNIAVEIWHLILQHSISVPYLLDTMIDRGPDYWRNSPRYHDVKVYAASEHRRKTMRLVCRSWRDFMDEYKHRWITYNSASDADPQQQSEFLEAVTSSTIISSEQQEMSETPSRPRRIMFHARNQHDIDIFGQLLEHCSSRITILFTECSEGYEDPLFELLLKHGAKLPNLRFLTLCGPNRSYMPLRVISTNFPKLFTIAISHSRTATYPIHPDDVLLLPNVEVLGLDLSQTPVHTIESWDLRGLQQLHTRLDGDYGNGINVSLEPLRILGANLTVLNIHKLRARTGSLRLPFEFWTWCPRLIELLIFMSAIYFDTAAPDNHPLKSIVHWAYFDDTELDTPWTTSTSLLERSILLHNLALLPIGLEVFTIWKTWARYEQSLSVRYNDNEKEELLAKMDDICVERAIRIEDRRRVTLGEFLVRRHLSATESALNGDFGDDSN